MTKKIRIIENGKEKTFDSGIKKVKLEKMMDSKKLNEIIEKAKKNQ